MWKRFSKNSVDCSAPHKACVIITLVKGGNGHSSVCWENVQSVLTHVRGTNSNKPPAMKGLTIRWCLGLKEDLTLSQKKKKKNKNKRLFPIACGSERATDLNWILVTQEVNLCPRPSEWPPSWAILPSWCSVCPEHTFVCSFSYSNDSTY